MKLSNHICVLPMSSVFLVCWKPLFSHTFFHFEITYVFSKDEYHLGAIFNKKGFKVGGKKEVSAKKID